MSAAILKRLATRAGDMPSKLAFDAAVDAVARHRGLEPERVRAGSRGGAVGRFGVTAHDPAGIARQEACYLAVVAFDRPGRSVARVAGLSHEAVRKALALTEDRRDACGLLDLIEQELCGC